EFGPALLSLDAAVCNDSVKVSVVRLKAGQEKEEEILCTLPPLLIFPTFSALSLPSYVYSVEHLFVSLLCFVPFFYTLMHPAYSSLLALSLSLSQTPHSQRTKKSPRNIPGSCL